MGCWSAAWLPSFSDAVADLSNRSVCQARVAFPRRTQFGNQGTHKHDHLRHSHLLCMTQQNGIRAPRTRHRALTYFSQAKSGVSREMHCSFFLSRLELVFLTSALRASGHCFSTFMYTFSSASNKVPQATFGHCFFLLPKGILVRQGSWVTKSTHVAFGQRLFANFKDLLLPQELGPGELRLPASGQRFSRFQDVPFSA